MWEVFRLNLITIKNYAGEHLLFIVVAAAFIYLLITEKDKKNRALFIYLPAAILIFSLFPHVRMLFARFIDEGDTYYRLLWLIPSGAVLSFAAERIFKKKRIAGFIIMAAAVIAAGSSMYGKEAREQNMISKASNPYHLPEEAVHVDAAAGPGPPARRQGVVRSGGIVPGAFRAPGADEYTARRSDVPGHFRGILQGDDEVFGGIGFRKVDDGLKVRQHDGETVLQSPVYLRIP